MRICGYLRVSGKGQLAGDGFERQREAIERLATANGWPMPEFYEELGITGKSEWDDRDAWVEMVASQPDIIIVENLSRLSREFAVQEIFWRQLRKINVRLLSAQEPDLEDDNADPTRKLIRGMLGLVHEYDRSQIESKLRAARARIRKHVGRCEGRKPFGHREGEGATLEKIVELKELRWTTRKIAAYLNDQGIATRTGKNWHRSVIAKILSAREQPLAVASLRDVAGVLPFETCAPGSRSISGYPAERP